MTADPRLVRAFTPEERALELTELYFARFATPEPRVATVRVAVGGAGEEWWVSGAGPSLLFGGATASPASEGMVGAVARTLSLVSTPREWTFVGLKRALPRPRPLAGRCAALRPKERRDGWRRLWRADVQTPEGPRVVRILYRWQVTLGHRAMVSPPLPGTPEAEHGGFSNQPSLVAAVGRAAARAAVVLGGRLVSLAEVPLGARKTGAR